MKKLVCFLCVILVMFSLVAYTQVGKTNNVVVSIKKSDKFSEKEINDAINCVKKIGIHRILWSN
jgi:PP-loop superfamily ATP-utilizing enzyme